MDLNYTSWRTSFPHPSYCARPVHRSMTAHDFDCSISRSMFLAIGAQKSIALKLACYRSSKYLRAVKNRIMRPKSCLLRRGLLKLTKLTVLTLVVRVDWLRLGALVTETRVFYEATGSTSRLARF